MVPVIANPCAVTCAVKFCGVAGDRFKEKQFRNGPLLDTTTQQRSEGVFPVNHEHRDYHRLVV
jgi:hypothetical protein